MTPPSTPAGGAVAWQFQDERDGKWCNFSNDKHRDATIADGRWPIRALYTQPPATVPAEAVMALVGKLRYSHINRQAIADELESLTREVRK